jgi:site-specific DNA-methyltransferase (adenine-specific)
VAFKTNALYYGDNLDILRRYVPDASVDLVYLDPPFNSNATYNVIFRDESGRKSDAQIVAFDDTWHWGPDAEEKYAYLTNTSLHQGRVPSPVGTLIAALRQGINPSPMLAYLVEMAVRLVELHRVLKPSGSLYLHCDPTASHYLKVLLDATFGPEHFRNEIIWRRSSGHNKLSRQYGPIHDTLLFYSRSDTMFFTPGVRPTMRGYIKDWFTGVDERGPFRTNMLTGPGTRTGSSGQPWRGFDPTSVGRHWAIPATLHELLPPEAVGWPTQQSLDYLHELGTIYVPRDGAGQPKYKQYIGTGVPYQDIWAYQPYTQRTLYGNDEAIDEDVKWVEHDKERLGYPTQKPLGLLRRVIESSCPPDGIVLDPFCGCGTALVAAQELDRRWIGIDVTYLAIAVMKARLRDSFGLADVQVIGQPTEVEGARAMLVGTGLEGQYQFQWWALDLVGAQPQGDTKKKGADKGVDGIINFTGAGGKMESVIVSVKSGGVGAAMVQQLKGAMETHSAAMGLFITLDEPTGPMKQEAAIAGAYHSELSGKDYPRLQILTIRELLEEHRKPDLPLLIMPTFQRAQRVEKKAADQGELFG